MKKMKLHSDKDERHLISQGYFKVFNLNYRLINTLHRKSAAFETLLKHVLVGVSKWSKDCKYN